MKEALRDAEGKGGLEMTYATLYQELVKMGVEPQLRKKYRP